MQKNILKQIGQTPLVPLKGINNTNCTISVKLENRNPGGSIKDLIAINMVNKSFECG